MTTLALPRSGDGTIGRPTACTVMAGFLLLIVVPGVWQAVDPNAKPLLKDFSADVRKEGYQRALQSLESRIERDAVFPSTVPRTVSNADARTLGSDERKDLPRPGWLSLLPRRCQLLCRPGAAVVPPCGTGSRSERPPRRCLRRRRASALRRIRRLAAPPPVETLPLVECTTASAMPFANSTTSACPCWLCRSRERYASTPEYYAQSYPLSAGPAKNRDMHGWMQKLAEDGVSVVDLASALGRESSGGAFLVPTHRLALVARGIGRFCGRHRRESGRASRCRPSLPVHLFGRNDRLPRRPTEIARRLRPVQAVSAGEDHANDGPTRSREANHRRRSTRFTSRRQLHSNVRGR